MKPIIKWSGGKSNEIKLFKHKIPLTFERYVEPFVGGGGVYFNLEHKKSIINDINFEITSLYSIISCEKITSFLLHLNSINNIREKINQYFSNISNKEILDIFSGERLTIDLFFYQKLDLLIEKSILDKVKRIRNIQIKEGAKFNEKQLIEHIQTATQSALYFHCRSIYNSGLKSNLEYYIANWYYVREFCYSSMFRFSNSGKFNVPYGGIGYNTKNFKNKIDNLSSSELKLLLSTTEINCCDFELFFKKHNYFNKNDFVFIDPPYDSEFSQYNKEMDFDKNEQIRLYNELLKVNSKLMIVIKQTDFIHSLYENQFNIELFDKKYLSNMRNRNEKDVKHLIITNY